MRSVKCTLDENEFRKITDEAKKLGVHRSDLIRTKITSAPKITLTSADAVRLERCPRALASGMVTPADYLDIVATLRKRMGNSIGRVQAEQATSIVLQCLHG